MMNEPAVKIGIVAVSRDCFPIELSKNRLGKLFEACSSINAEVFAMDTIIETETDAINAHTELMEKDINTLVIYLGNFGPEGPTAKLIRMFNGPVMACAAAEETGENLFNGRGDAYCGLMNLSYNLNLNSLKAHIPENPVGLPNELANEIDHFEKIAKIYHGIKGLKVISFGPRPFDFLACNAPIKPLFDLGIDVMENSELDLLQLYKNAKNNDDINTIVKDMEQELGDRNPYPDLLPKMAQLESALLKFAEDNKGTSEYVVFANKCWPAFEAEFGFVPCYVNSRMAGHGIPVGCEVDLYGAVSQYICQLASDHPATLLDINNTVPKDMLSKDNLDGYQETDLFMGFHCGNTNSKCLCDGCKLDYQLIMNRLMEDSKTPDITRGTLDGRLKPGTSTLFRLQSSASGKLQSYLAEGDVLDIDPKSFGGIGVIAVPELARFYRHVMVEDNYPHHAALAFKRVGSVIFDALKLLTDIVPSTPKPKGSLYPKENPFA